MKKQQRNKKNMVVAIAVLGIIGMVPNITSAMGPGSGGRIGQNMMSEDGVPIGLQDEDGDGIVNKDDEDFEKPMLNARDNDDDGVPNKIDEDYVPAQDGTGRSETAGNRAGQVNSNKPEGVGNGQMGQGISPAKDRMNAPIQVDSEQVIKKQTQQKIQNRVMNENEENTQIRTQLHTMIQTRERMQQTIANDVIQLQNQNKLSKFFVGADNEAVEHAQNQLNVYEQKIDVLKQMSESAVNAEDKAAIDAQIVQMEEMHIQMENLVAQNSGEFSLFGWMKNLFN